MGQSKLKKTPAPHKTPIANAVEATLGESNSQQVHHQLIGVQQTQVYQGAIPHPDVLRGFDELVPGTAQRLIQLAEDESLHRRSLETAAMQANIEAQQRSLAIGEYQSKAVFRSDTIGQASGLIVSILCIAGAIYARNETAIALALAALPTAAVIKAFAIKKAEQTNK